LLFKFNLCRYAEVLVPRNSFRNPVHNSQWGAAAFSHDGEYVVGARAGGHHELHIWNRATVGAVQVAFVCLTCQACI
jgi:hypothetical protein